MMQRHLRRFQPPLYTTGYIASSAVAASAQVAVGARHAGAGAGRSRMRRVSAPPRIARAQRIGGVPRGDEAVSNESVDCDAELKCGIGENWPGLADHRQVLCRKSKFAGLGD